MSFAQIGLFLFSSVQENYMKIFQIRPRPFPLMNFQIPYLLITSYEMMLSDLLITSLNKQEIDKHAMIFSLLPLLLPPFLFLSSSYPQTQYLIVLQTFKTFKSFNGIFRFITVFTKACCLSLLNWTHIHLKILNIIIPSTSTSPNLSICCRFQTNIFTCILVTTDGVWTGDSIYWTHKHNT